MTSTLHEKIFSIHESPVAILAVGIVIGFAIGRITAPLSTGEHPPAAAETPGIPIAKRKPKEATESENSDEESEHDGELQDFTSSSEECKLVLVVRTDLGMTKGKIAAQCSHATLACYKALLKQESLSRKPSTMLRRWEKWGQAKVTVQVKSEEDLLILQAQAMSLGLCAKIIHDAGRTQIASGSATVLGIGPGPKSVVDQVTGHLKLL